MPPCQVGHVRFSGSPRNRSRDRIVGLHIELRIVFDGLAGLRIDAFRPVQIVDVLGCFDKFPGRTIQRIEESITAKMTHDFPSLASDNGVVEHMDADLVVVHESFGVY